MADVFGPRDFTDGSSPGSDPYDNVMYPKPAPWASPKDKADRANAIARFLQRGVWDDKTTGEAFSDLLGYGPPVRRQELDDPKKIATFVQRLLDRPRHTWHDTTRPRLNCDVEERLAEWLRTSGEGDFLIAEGNQFIEERERAQLRTLMAKYPDEVQRD